MELSQLAISGPRHAPELNPVLLELLADLGHRCPGTSQAATEELGANVWFARRNPAPLDRRDLTLVVIDTTLYRGSLTRWIRLLHRINHCTSTDRIHVAERRHGEAGHALAAIAPLISTVELMTRRHGSKAQHRPATPGRACAIRQPALTIWDGQDRTSTAQQSCFGEQQPAGPLAEAPCRRPRAASKS